METIKSTNRFLVRLIELIDNYRIEGVNKIDAEIRVAERNGYILSVRESKYYAELLRMKVDEI